MINHYNDLLLLIMQYFIDKGCKMHNFALISGIFPMNIIKYLIEHIYRDG